MADTDPVDIKSLRRATDIVQVLQDRGGASVSTVAEELGMPLSTVHGHLDTLYDLEYLTKDGSEYHVGLRFLDHGIHARDSLRIVDEASDTLSELAAETGEVVYLMVEDHGNGVYVDEAKGDRGIETRGRIGKRVGLHAIAAGKSILAHLDRERVDEIVDRHGLPSRTDDTITDREELHETLAEIRDRGFAFNDNEELEGIRAVGAPVVVEGAVLGAVSVSGPAKRFQGSRFEEDLPNKVLSATNTIELKMQY